MDENRGKELADVVWKSWGSLYANGHICRRETIVNAVSAYNEIEFSNFEKNSKVMTNRIYEAVANLISHANYYGLEIHTKSPEIVHRMVKVYRMLRIQWTTGGFIGNVLLGFYFRLTSADYRWFFNLDNR